jgi:hypothetical protein
MAQTELDKEFFKAGTSFDRPIPGQSLTNDPEAPAPFERAPKYTDKSEVLTYYFDLFTDEDNYGNILNALDEDISIMEIVKVFLFKGFEDGLFNPDMMLIVAEPLAYMIAALAERAGVEFTIMGDADEYEDDEEEEDDKLPVLNKALGTINKPQMDEDFPSELADSLEKVTPPKGRSLLGER